MIRMAANTHAEFAGISAFLRAQSEQLALFRSWAKQNNWARFHHEHYDWWTFPTGEPSSYKFKWTVYESEIYALTEADGYVQNLIELSTLLMQSWGWDLAAREYIANPAPDQRWSHWPIRLYKCALSLKLFGCEAEFQSVRQYARDRIADGERFWYNRDLSWLFE